MTHSLHTQEGRIGIRLDSLPPIAKRKFNSLRALAEDSAALTRVALSREKPIEDALYDAQRRRSHVNPDAEPERATYLNTEVQELEAELQRLNTARMARASIGANWEQILAQLKFAFLAAEDFNFPAVRAYAGPPAHPRDGEDLAAAIMRVRGEISRAQAELTRTKTAPPSPTEAKAAVIAEIKRLAAIGKPRLNLTDGGGISISFCDQQVHAAPGTALAAPSGSASALMCWLFTEKIIEHATANLDGIEGGISTADRKHKLAELAAELFALECDEESLIEQAQATGLEAHRRPFASPLALLGLEVVPAFIEPAPTPSRRRLNGNATTNEDNDARPQAAE